MSQPRIETIRELQVLSQGRGLNDRSGAYVFAPNGAPTSEGAGFPVEALDPRPIVALLGVELSAVPTRLDATFTVASVVAGDTYTLTHDAVDYDYVASGSDDASDIASALAALLNAAPSFTATATATAVGAEIRIVGVVGATYTLVASGPGPGHNRRRS